MPVTLKKLEDGTYAVDPVQLLEAADNEIADQITRLFSPDMHYIDIVSTLCRVIGFTLAKAVEMSGQDFDQSVKDGLSVSNFMIAANAKMAWDVRDKGGENGRAN